MALDLDQLRQRRDEILKVAAKHGAKDVRVFGSVARDEARADSDVDLLVDFVPGSSLLDLVGFEQELEELLGCHVDVVSDGGISPYMEDRILAEAVEL